ncbi:diguanylate cyclase [Blastopirellula sp. JC732]|uniref:diguanylate cyclase n=1 Tax=Blastopirellula sediminis TaxID=2894196 RepID=A0A9X1MTH9_9BACT|nr:diguanylate cyclase [Blastopirellula sediminis]MCC9604581.1 diguanylate cyclase [Blastopirellula sediminis]MCC9632120.1 diguanylate cyclase [Blastopirellula sediminis]
MQRRPLRVLLVSPDRSFLRRTAEFLSACRLEAYVAADADQAEWALASREPDLVIVDTNTPRAAAVLQSPRRDQHSTQAYVYAIAITDSDSPERVFDALAGGADDIIPRPLRFTELLVRIRAAARSLEVESRLHRRVGRRSGSGLGNSGVLLRLLREDLRDAATTGNEVSLVLFDVDYALRFGPDPGFDRIVEQVTTIIRSEMLPTYRMCQPSVDQLAVLLPNSTSDEAYQWAEEIRQTIAAADFQHADSTLKLSVSVGVAASADSGPIAEELWENVQERLEFAKKSGGNFVASLRQLQNEDAAGGSSHGRLFDGTTTADVLRPTFVQLASTTPADEVIAAFAKHDLDVAPVLDAQRKFAGAITRDVVQNRAVRSRELTAAELVDANFPQMESNASFSELVNYFSEHPTPCVAIVDRGKPLGFVSRDDLALLSEPIDSTSYAESRDDIPTTEFYVVSRPLMVEMGAEA